MMEALAGCLGFAEARSSPLLLVGVLVRTDGMVDLELRMEAWAKVNETSQLHH
jgi:hypothetical protein